ncbi:type II toxin-antitoxin system VapC family toxin [bacterium]|nr:type II toxin-antitoxin system VapC family toxin [bacterium]
MKKILIDTNIYCNAMRGMKSAADVIQCAENILMSPIVIGELYSGFKKGKYEKRNREQLRKFINSPRIKLLQISDNTSDFYSYILTQLRKNGTPIPTNDIWIAASVFENGAKLASLDAHFLKVAGLQLVDL